MLMMVSDSNFLRKPMLARYLAQGLDYKLLLADLVIMEMRKTNALSTSRESLQIVSGYLPQIFVLRDVYQIMCTRVTRFEETDALFDYYQSGGLQDLCDDLYRFPPSPNLVRYFDEAGDLARRQITQLREGVASVEPAMIEAADEFNDAELRQLRRMRGVRPETQDKVLKLMQRVGGELIREATGRKRLAPMKWKDALSMFAFRYALCATLYYLFWVKDGQPTRKLERRLNDIVDLQLAALGTFFGGVLSEDRKLLLVSANARAILRQMDAYVGEGPVPGH